MLAVSNHSRKSGTQCSPIKRKGLGSPSVLPPPNWARVVLGVAWLHEVEVTVAGISLLYWPTRFVVPRRLPVWQKDPVGVGVFCPFLYLDFFVGEASLNVTAMGLAVEVLSARRTFNVPTAHTLASIGTVAFVCVISRFTNK